MGIELMAPDPKRPWASKTVIAGVLVAVVPALYPPAAVWIAANPALLSAGLGLLFGVLRFVSHGKVTFTD